MSDKFTGDYGTSGRSDGPYSHYSRSAGVQSYRHKRRQGSAFKIVVYTMLVMVIGGALVLLSRHFLGDFLPSPSSSSTQEAEMEQMAEITTVQPAEITLVAAGDVVMNGSVVESGRLESGAYNFDHLFSHLSGELSQFDLRTVDQETGLAGSEFGFGSEQPLNAPQELGRAEIEAGFNVILRATDHTLDLGHEGVHNELQWWNNEHPEIPLLGVAEPDPEENPGLNDYVNNVYIFDKDGFKVAVLNHSWSITDEERGVVSVLAEDQIASDVQKARDEGANMIIACPHWGMEYNTEPSEEEMAFAQVYANNGVDVVIGTHPRVLQRVDVLQSEDGHRTICYYSLGCLISSLDSQSLVGGLAEITLSRDDTGNYTVSSAALKPVVTHRGNGDDFGTYLLSDYSTDLAQSGWDYGLTPEEVDVRCSDILGEGYNADEDVYRVAL